MKKYIMCKQIFLNSNCITMKVYAKLLSLISLGSFFLMTGCDKPQKEDILTKEQLAGTYKVTALKYISPSGQEQDIFSSLPDCDKESRQILNSNSTFEFIDACTPPENRTGTWSLPSSDKIVIDGLEADLVSFDGHNLMISVMDLGGSMSGKVTETLTRQ
jgi:hypothetical protein